MQYLGAKNFFEYDNIANMSFQVGQATYTFKHITRNLDHGNETREWYCKQIMVSVVVYKGLHI